MVMIARVNICQFVLIVFNLWYFRQFHAVDEVPRLQAGVTRSSKVRNKMVDIVNKTHTWKDYFVNCDIDLFSVSLRTVSYT